LGEITRPLDLFSDAARGEICRASLSMVEAIARLCHPGGIEIGFDAGPEASAEARPVHAL
jgi:hypothetical protein